MQESTEKTYTILVIEDEPDMLRLLERILDSAGYRVILATAGNVGMALIREHEPDLVLLDIMMPGPDGYMTLESIRKYCNVPVIMVTARRDTEALQRAINLGADDFIRKPFYDNELIARIKAKLRRV